MDERLLSPLFSDLYLLTVLASTRSYTKAANRLGISKASASSRISELEKVVSIPLVRRTSRSVSLTEAGQRLVEDIEPGFSRITEGFTSTRDDVGLPRGLLRVSAPVTIGRQLVMPLLPGFLKAYPDVRLELDLADRLVSLQQEGFDLAIQHAQSASETHVAWPLCESRSFLVASADYLQRSGIPSHPSELERHRCLLYLRGGTAQRWSFERRLPRGKKEKVDVEVNGPFKANDSELLRDAALAGVGIGLLPDFSCAQAIREQGLVSLLDEWTPVNLFGNQIYAIRPYLGSQVPRAVLSFVEYLKEGFRVADSARGRGSASAGECD